MLFSLMSQLLKTDAEKTWMEETDWSERKKLVLLGGGEATHPSSVMLFIVLTLQLL